MSLALSLGSPPARAKPLVEGSTITEKNILALFPKATKIGEFMNDPPVWPVFQLHELIGYAFQSRQLTNFSGFSGEPINLLIGINAEGHFTGVKVIDHHEPIFLHGLGEQSLLAYLQQYSGIRISDRVILRKPGTNLQAAGDGTVYFDAVTKATVSIIVINDTVLSSALKVARGTLEEFAQQAPAVVNVDRYTEMAWQQLLDQGLVKHWSVHRDSIESALGNPISYYAEAQQSSLVNSDVTEIYFALLDPPSVGRNLLGEKEFNRLNSQLRDSESAVLLMSNGFYDVIGNQFKPGTIPERFNLLQKGLPIPIRDMNFYNYQIPSMMQGAPIFSNARVFKIRPSSGFDPSAPMNLQISFDFKKNHLITHRTSLTTKYQLPDQLFTRVSPVVEQRPRPTWMTIWIGRWIEIAVLLAGLALLVTLFIGQRRIMKSIRHFYYIRWGFLMFTLFFIGFYAQGQLSVVNIFTLLAEITKGFDLAVFLLDPIIFILWIFTFVTLFVWGRGVFCGWLCPFGALQEMVAWVARRLDIRQWKLGERTHTYLLKTKYLILIALTFISIFSLNTAMVLSEVEPFKTAITLYFVRSWPFILYAILLLGIGLYINKFYCRYICPLGGGLAILGKLHFAEQIPRRSECGSKCQMCRNRCQVNAINRNGAIDYTECIQCLECLAIINDPKQCAIDLLALKQSDSVNSNNIPQLTHKQARPFNAQT